MSNQYGESTPQPDDNIVHLNPGMIFDGLLGRSEMRCLALEYDQARIDLAYARMEVLRLGIPVMASLGRDMPVHDIIANGPRSVREISPWKAQQLLPLANRWMERYRELERTVFELAHRQTTLVQETLTSPGASAGSRPVLWEQWRDKETLNDLRNALEAIERAWSYSWDLPEHANRCHALYRLARRSWTSLREAFERNWMRG